MTLVERNDKSNTYENFLVVILIIPDVDLTISDVIRGGVSL
jgi:hypothetical protein